METFFRAKILCFGAFGANIHCYTKYRGPHGCPFHQPLHPTPFARPPPPEQFLVAQSITGSMGPQRPNIPLGRLFPSGASAGFVSGALARHSPRTFQKAQPPCPHIHVVLLRCLKLVPVARLPTGRRCSCCVPPWDAAPTAAPAQLPSAPRCAAQGPPHSRMLPTTLPTARTTPPCLALLPSTCTDAAL